VGGGKAEPWPDSCGDEKNFLANVLFCAQISIY
jgi:hypothetical protein